MRRVVESLERTHTEKKMTFGKKAVENHAKAVHHRWSVFLWEPSSFKKLHARKKRKENVPSWSWPPWPTWFLTMQEMWSFLEAALMHNNNLIHYTVPDSDDITIRNDSTQVGNNVTSRHNSVASLCVSTFEVSENVVYNKTRIEWNKWQNFFPSIFSLHL